MLYKLRLNKIKEKCLLLLISTTPLSAIAHSGHDHQSQWANLIHLLWVMPIVLGAYMLMKQYKKKLNIEK